MTLTVLIRILTDIKIVFYSRSDSKVDHGNTENSVSVNMFSSLSILIPCSKCHSQDTYEAKKTNIC